MEARLSAASFGMCFSKSRKLLIGDRPHTSRIFTYAGTPWSRPRWLLKASMSMPSGLVTGLNTWLWKMKENCGSKASAGLAGRLRSTEKISPKQNRLQSHRIEILYVIPEEEEYFFWCQEIERLKVELTFVYDADFVPHGGIAEVLVKRILYSVLVSHGKGIVLQSVKSKSKRHTKLIPIRLKPIHGWGLIDWLVDFTFILQVILCSVDWSID